MEKASSAHAAVVAELTSRWPEQQVAPSLARVQALMDLLGDPQRSCPVIQITGTNGKGSTAIIIDALLRAQGLRTGRFSSPHLGDLTERICIDGIPIEPERFDEMWAEVRPFVELVDAQQIDDIPLTFFEALTGLAYAAFADAPVDVMVIEVGMGGTWDATNVADAEVAVVTPIGLDHTDYLGGTVAEIATEKAGIIKPGSQAVLAAQTPEAAKVLMARCASVGALAQRDGIEFGLLERTPAVGGQVIRINAAEGPIGDLHLPLYGAHMANNAALAVAAVEALSGGRSLAPDVIQDAFDVVAAPARTELVRRSPAIVVDTCHNPPAAEATMAAMAEAFAFSPLIGVVGMMLDKDAESVLKVFAEEMTTIVVTQADSPRALPAEELAEIARGIVGDDRVVVQPKLADAIETAAALADEAGPTAGVLVAGSVALAGQARALLHTEDEADR